MKVTPGAAAARLLSNPHFLGTAKRHLRAIVEQSATLEGAIGETAAVIAAGADAQRAAFDLVLAHDAVKLVALIVDLSQEDGERLRAAIGVDEAQREALDAVAEALRVRYALRGGLRRAVPELEDAASLGAPTSWSTPPVVIDLRPLMAALDETLVDRAPERWDPLVRGAIDAGAALGAAQTVLDKATALLSIAMQRAVALLVKEHRDRLDASEDPTPVMLFEVPLEWSCFRRAEWLSLVYAVGEAFAGWLMARGLSEPRARGVADRLGRYFAAEVAAEWRRRPEVYAGVWAELQAPLDETDARARDWHHYRARLQRAPAEPLFGDTLALAQVYQPLRAYWRERVGEGGEGDRDELYGAGPLHGRPAGETRRVVVDAHAALNDWLAESGPDDAIRVVSGGPGAGKSSLSVWLAADRASRGERVLRVPLHRFDLEHALRAAVLDFAKRDCGIEHDIFDESGPLLLIFDGLDELSMQGRSGREAAVELVDAVARLVAQENDAGRPVRVVLLGRELVVDGLGERARREGMVLRLLPYAIGEARDEYHDPHNLLAVDQRVGWWAAYGRWTSGGPVEGMPAELDRGRLALLSAEPLLNYLIALTRAAGRVPLDDPDINENTIYADLVRQIFERAHAEGRRLPVAEEVRFEDFERFLEAIALAAWHGEGRVATVDEITRATGPRLLKLLDVLQQKAEAGISRLMTVFYFRQGRGRRDGVKTFEFTHKSFGEYLLARRLIRFVELLADESERWDDGRGGWSLEQRLVEWYRLFGPAPMDNHIFDFVFDELRLCGEVEVAQWQSLIASLTGSALQSDFPLELSGERLPFRSELERVNNAMQALLMVASACWRVTGKRTQVRHPYPSAFRHCVDRFGGTTGAINSAWSQHLDGLVLTGCYLSEARLFGANLRGADLSGAVIVLASLRYTDLRGANLEGALLASSDLRRAKLDDARLDRAVFDSDTIWPDGFEPPFERMILWGGDDEGNEEGDED